MLCYDVYFTFLINLFSIIFSFTRFVVIPAFSAAILRWVWNPNLLLNSAPGYLKLSLGIIFIPSRINNGSTYLLFLVRIYCLRFVNHQLQPIVFQSFGHPQQRFVSNFLQCFCRTTSRYERHVVCKLHQRLDINAAAGNILCLGGRHTKLSTRWAQVPKPVVPHK